FTKFGDGGFDLSPLGGLTKRRVRSMALALGGDEKLAYKVPTADLETMRPLRPDEAVLGVIDTALAYLNLSAPPPTWLHASN
ncbi:MAG: hypothetical protein DPW14_17740, partial [Planctomycetes bacterium]|nr:hypothetical protein [Planctomycetota bacterium]